MEALDWQFRECKSNDQVPFCFCCSFPAPHGCPEWLTWGAAEVPMAPVALPSPPKDKRAQGAMVLLLLRRAHSGGLRQIPFWLQTAKAP